MTLLLPNKLDNSRLGKTLSGQANYVFSFEIQMTSSMFGARNMNKLAIWLCFSSYAVGGYGYWAHQSFNWLLPGYLIKWQCV